MIRNKTAFKDFLNVFLRRQSAGSIRRHLCLTVDDVVELISQPSYESSISKELHPFESKHPPKGSQLRLSFGGCFDVGVKSTKTMLKYKRMVIIFEFVKDELKINALQERMLYT